MADDQNETIGRVAVSCLVARGAGRRPGRPGVFWLNGFRSSMHGGKATAVADWCRHRDLDSIRFDYRGNGDSGGRFEDMTIGDWLDDARGVFRRNARGPQILVGSSMGGWLAVLLARERLSGAAPGTGIAGLILIAPAIDMTERLISERLSSAEREALERDGLLLRPSAYDDAPYPVTRQLVDEGRRHLIGREPFELGVPVHIIHGARDPDVPVSVSQDLCACLAGDDVRLTLIPDGEHRLSRPADIDIILGAIGAMADYLSASPDAQSAPSPSR